MDRSESALIICCEKPVADGISIFLGTLPCSNAKTIGLRIQPGMSKPLCLSGQRRWARSDCSASLVIIRRPRRAFRSVKPPQPSEMRKYGLFIPWSRRISLCAPAQYITNQEDMRGSPAPPYSPPPRPAYLRRTTCAVTAWVIVQLFFFFFTKVNVLFDIFVLMRRDYQIPSSRYSLKWSHNLTVWLQPVSSCRSVQALPPSVSFTVDCSRGFVLLAFFHLQSAPPCSLLVRLPPRCSAAPRRSGQTSAGR